VEPVPETGEVLDDMARYGDTELAVALRQMSDEVIRIAPDCIGLSLAVVAEGLTFTMATTDSVIRDLDSMQYLDGGPCVEAAHSGEVHHYERQGPLDEDRWEMFARATAVRGVGSTLSLPVIRSGRVVAGVNLYGATTDTFAGRHERLAEVCGSRAADVVTNADLTVTTRTEAAQAPGRLQDQYAVDVATGMLAEARGIDVDTAQAQLRSAAEQAHVSPARAAAVLIATLRA
jgi:hypothetical protein